VIGTLPKPDHTSILAITEEKLFLSTSAERIVQGRFKKAHIDGVEQLLVVGSGKGGVGKSTVSVNLAVALAKQGAMVGLLDGDAYGPSVPMMLGVRKHGESSGWQASLPLARRGKLSRDQMLKPLVRYGVKVMSVGFFIGEEQAVAPMPDVLGMLIRQLLYLVDWGTLDYLVIDLPPGNGEPQATLCREMALDGAILVTTPQDIARIDTAKALAMFQRVQVPVLGVVQNMDGFLCPHCGEAIEVFPASRESRAVLDTIPLLGKIPLDPAAVIGGDKGQPIIVSKPESAIAIAFQAVAEQVVARLKTSNLVDDAQPAATGEEYTKEESKGDERED
jgi:ATP-binding protein involved in chromosome partitioning